MSFFKGSDSKLLKIWRILVFGWLLGGAMSWTSVCGAEVQIDRIYDPNRLMEVRIELESDDWMNLRRQHPDRLAQMQGREANSEPYSMFPARVWIDGEDLGMVGLRKKGNLGSVVSSRPSFKLSMDHVNEKQRFLGAKRLTLNNNQQNGALFHQFLAYFLFRKAGVPAPLCNLAHVVVNGENLGIYSNVEPIRKPMLKRVFGEGDGNLYESGGAFSGNAFRSFPKKNNRKAADWSDLEAVANALAKEDAGMLESLGEALDLEAFYRFWAMDVLIGDWDGYICNGNNVYLYHNPANRKVSLIPWGMDSVFEDPGLYIVEEVPKSVKAVRPLPRRLYEWDEGRRRYLEVMQGLLDQVWDEEELLGLIERLKPMVKERLHFPFSELELELESVEDFIRGRRAEVQRELDLGGVDWPEAGNRRPMSGGALAMALQFETAWKGRLGPDVSTSLRNNEIQITWEGGQEVLQSVQAVAGQETSGPRLGYPLISLEGQSERFGPVGVRLYIDPFAYPDKKQLAVDFYEVFGVLVRRPEGVYRFRGSDFLGFAIGRVQLRTASQRIGDPVEGKGTLQVILK